VAAIALTHDYHDRIRALEDDDPASYLPASDSAWRRIFARLQPDDSPWALLAYEPRHCSDHDSAWSALTVEVFETGEGGAAAIAHPAGDLVISSIVDDPNLPGLRRLADQAAQSSLLRYRPRRRCTLRVTDDKGTHVVKVLADDRGQQFHRDAGALWDAAQRGELNFAVAEPSRWDHTTQSVWQGIVPGEPVAAALLAPGGASMAERIGAALGTLARSGVRPSMTVTSDDQLRRTRRAVDNAIRRVPALADDLQEILGIFATRHAALSPDRLVPVHGAPHMHQWLLDGDHLGLIDFDRFALGEVELDIATLLTELDYEEELADAPDAIEAAVVAGFRSVDLDIDPARLQLYRAHKRMSKVTREAWALRTNGEHRARRHLPRILEDLE
jgi:thiamine kinase-like enzyme